MGQGEDLGSGSRGWLLLPPPLSFAEAGLLVTQHRSCGLLANPISWDICYLGLWCAPLDPPCVSGLSRGNQVPCPGRQSIGAASPPAATAASLLNYINRPPSSVIFYYMGKKRWAGQVKIHSLGEHQPARHPHEWPRGAFREPVGKPSARLESLKLGVKMGFLC